MGRVELSGSYVAGTAFEYQVASCTGLYFISGMLSNSPK